jgi:phosphodiesterase/alkaline phosphatase D-like protein
MGVLAYLQTPLGGMVKDILGISGTGTTTDTDTNTNTNTDTNTAVDTTKPALTFPIEPTVGPTSVSINWTTDELSSSQVEYGLSTTYNITVPTQPDTDPGSGQSAGVTTHAVVITGLQPETTYHYRVKSKDAAGNEAVSDDRTFTTTSASAT